MLPARLLTVLPSLPLSPSPQPPNPQPEEVRSLAAQAIEEAKRMPPVPPFVDYSALLADLQRWIAELEGAAADVDQAQAVGDQLVGVWCLRRSCAALPFAIAGTCKASLGLGLGDAACCGPNSLGIHPSPRQARCPGLL